MLHTEVAIKIDATERNLLIQENYTFPLDPNPSLIHCFFLCNAHQNSNI